jgi:hypothetical protein
MEVGPADLLLPSAGPATSGLAPAAPACAVAAHAMPRAISVAMPTATPAPAALAPLRAQESGRAAFVELPASMATAAPVAAGPAHAGPAFAAPASAASAAIAHVQAFNKLLHDMWVCLAELAAQWAITLTTHHVDWSTVHRRVDIFVVYRVAEGSVASPTHLRYIQEFLARMAKPLRSCPHVTRLLLDMPPYVYDAACC